MSHYRAVMSTTINCEGCEFDSNDACTRPDGCFLMYCNHEESQKERTIAELEEELWKILKS